MLTIGTSTMRHWRRSRRRSSMRPTIRTFKKVLNFAPASTGAGVQQDQVVITGVDSLAIGQTSPTDATVPTGSKIAYFEIQLGMANLAAVMMATHLTVQRLVSGQTAISPLLVGGNAQRNQVFYQSLRVTGNGQNQTWTIKFKVPPKFQRMAEGTAWMFSFSSHTASSFVTQIIYKVQL